MRTDEKGNVVWSQSEAVLRVAWNEIKKHVDAEDLYEKGDDAFDAYCDRTCICVIAGIMQMTDAILNVIKDHEEDGEI